MKFQVARQDLEAALAVVTPAMASSGGDISSHYLFRPYKADPKKMEVLTYGGRLTAAAPFVASIEGDHTSFTIEGSRLKNWIGVVPDGSVLNFEYEKVDGQAAETTVSVHNDPRKHIVFQTLDPATFPYWDKIMNEVKPTGKVNAERLRVALKRAGLFTAEESNSTKEAGLSVVEIREGGTVTSTNKHRLCITTMKALEKSKIRIHTKDISGLTAFLSLCKNEEVEVLEHDWSFYLKRVDGSYFGETRYHDTFKAIGTVPNFDQYTWAISRAAVNNALKAVRQGASKEDDRLWLIQKDGDLVLKMETSSGKAATWNIPVKAEPLKTLNDDGSPVLDSNNKPLAAPPQLPESIQINISNFEKLIDGLSDQSADEFVLGVNYMPGKKSGYFRHSSTRFVQEGVDQGDTTLIMVVWNKNQ